MKQEPLQTETEVIYEMPDIEELFALYADDVLRLCNVYLRKHSLAEDAFQDVFVKLMLKADTFRGETPVKYWVLTITRHVCLDYLKSTWVSKVSSYEEWTERRNQGGVYQKRRKPISETVVEDKIVDRLDEDSPLLKAVQALPTKYKDVILLRFYMDLSNAEIAEQLSITESSVRSRLMRARKKLEPFFEGKEE